MPTMRIAVSVGLAGLLALGSAAQRTKPVEEKVGDGTLLHVLPADAIPAVDNPVFISAKEADRQMKPDEPVLGIYDGRVAKAYSLWHLDQHEIVNDRMPKLGPIAVTW